MVRSSQRQKELDRIYRLFCSALREDTITSLITGNVFDSYHTSDSIADFYINMVARDRARSLAARRSSSPTTRLSSSSRRVAERLESPVQKRVTCHCTQCLGHRQVRLKTRDRHAKRDKDINAITEGFAATIGESSIMANAGNNQVDPSGSNVGRKEHNSNDLNAEPSPMEEEADKQATSQQSDNQSTMSLDFGLKGVHVLVSGASGGIGIETAKTFLQTGAKVTAHYNSTPREISSMPGLVGIQADVTQEDQVARLFAQAAEAQGCPVQVLIVNHGVWPVPAVPLSQMTLQQWRQTHAINLDGSFLLIRAFLAALEGQPAQVLAPVSICMIGSTAGKFGEHDHADYASTKAALMYGLLPTLKNEIVRIAPKGRVNCVNPGWVYTPLAAETINDDNVRARALASTPLQKVAMPTDVANQVVMMSSPTLSGHVTGVNIMVDGGMEGRCLYPPPN